MSKLRVEYIVVHNSGTTYATDGTAKRVAELMLEGGEIVTSWVVGDAVHHLIKYEAKL